MAGLLKDLIKKKQPRVFNLQKDAQYFRYIVLGDDLGALLSYFEMEKLFGDQVKLLAKKPFHPDDFSFPQVSHLRGHENINYIQKLYPNAIKKMQDKGASFYKDKSFKDFDKSTKHEKLVADEEFFTQPCAWVDLKALNYDLEEICLKANEALIPAHAACISQTTPQEFIDPVNWNVECLDGRVFSCQELIYTNSMESFLKLFSSKDLLSDEFLELSESQKGTLFLTVNFEASKKVHENEQTLFLPQSLTHEWGHFIGEFCPYDAEKGRQIFSFSLFLHETLDLNEKISQKIKLLRRNLKRVFPEFSKVKVVEKINLLEISPCAKIDDSVLSSNEKVLEHFSLVGLDKPLEHFAKSTQSFEDLKKSLSGFSRFIFSLNNLKKKFSSL